MFVLNVALFATTAFVARAGGKRTRMTVKYEPNL